MCIIRNRMQLNLLLITVILVPTIAAWRGWALKDRHALAGVRQVLFLAALAAVSAAIILYTLLVIQAHTIGGFGANFPALLAWVRPGSWLSLAAMPLSLFGRGKSRAFAALSSSLMTVRWLLLVWVM